MRCFQWTSWWSKSVLDRLDRGGQRRRRIARERAITRQQVELLEDRWLLSEGSLFSTHEFVSSSGGVIASVSKDASQVGIDILDRGGNAIDAAIATAFALGVTRPDWTGLGAGGFMVYRGADGTTAALDFREVGPTGGPDGLKGGNVNAPGHLATAVPGTVAGFTAALAKYGSGYFTLADVIGPAWKLAHDGVIVSPELAANFAGYGGNFYAYPASSEIYLDHPAGLPPGSPGIPYAPGETLVQSDYAKSLALIATYGRDAFYGDTSFPAFDYDYNSDGIVDIHYAGPTDPNAPLDSLARLIVADFKNAGQYVGNTGKDAALMSGWMTLQDLQNYHEVWRDPLIGTYRGMQIIAMPPPASGIIALETLNLLERFPLNESQSLDDTLNPLTSWQQSSANHLHVVHEGVKIAWADRTRYLADPGTPEAERLYDFDGDGDFEPVPTGSLTSKDYASGKEINLYKAEKTADNTIDNNVDNPLDDLSGSPASHTTHFSVIDQWGNAVSMTLSLNSPFGCTAVMPGTGILLNDTMWDFSTAAAAPMHNAAVTGARPRSNQSPTIVVDENGHAVLVVGGAGGFTIPPGVIQTIVNFVDFDRGLAHAVDDERILPFNALPGAFFGGNQTGYDMYLENRADFPPGTIPELERRGHVVVPVGEYNVWYAPPIPVVEAVGFDPQSGKNVGFSDPRSEDGAIGQTKQADLLVANIIARSNHTAQGEKVTITATITNRGTAAAGVSKTLFLLDDTTTLGVIETPLVAAGSSVSVSVSFGITASMTGDHTVRVTADKTGVVRESSETNNVAILRLTIKGNSTSDSTFVPTSESTDTTSSGTSGSSPPLISTATAIADEFFATITLDNEVETLSAPLTSSASDDLTTVDALFASSDLLWEENSLTDPLAA